MPFKDSPVRGLQPHWWVSVAFPSISIVKNVKQVPRVIAAIAIAGSSALVLSGCFNGPNATTTLAANQPIGNGVHAELGEISVDAVTLVAGPDGSSAATLIMRVTNSGNEADTMLVAVVDGLPAAISGGAVAVNPGDSLSFGFDSDLFVDSVGFNAPVGSFVPVALQFERSGIAELEVLVVPPTGFYEGIAPSTS